MSQVPSASEFFSNINNNKDNKAFKLATVTAVSSGSPKIKFDGENTASLKQYAYIDGYIPVIGDRVLLASVGGSYIVIGKINSSNAPAV